MLENYLTFSKDEKNNQDTKFEVVFKNDKLYFKLNTVIIDPNEFKIPFNWEFECTLVKDSAKCLKDEVIEPSLMLLSLFEDERLEFLVKQVFIKFKSLG